MNIYYSVENCGDGSAYPRFFATSELAEWHQEHLDEGWGETCTGSIKVEGEGIICSEALTAVGYYLELLDDGCYDDDDETRVKEFVAEFLPDGIPTFTLTVKNENYWNIVADGLVVVGKKFAHPEMTEEARLKAEAEINEFGLTLH